MSVAALEHDLALAAGAQVPGLHAALAADPLRLDLPALPGPVPSAELCRTVGALWLDVSLDSAGLLRCAEWLSDHRATLVLGADDAASLETYAARRAGWVPGPARDVLAARVFGVGPLAVSGSSDAARFVPALAALASAIIACGPRQPGPALGAHASVTRTAGDLAGVLGIVAAEAVGQTTAALTDQLRWSVAVLSRPGVCALAGARDLWDLVRRMQGDRAPDLRRLLDQGRHGQSLLRWLASVVGLLARSPALGPGIAPDVVAAAGTWLQACGLTAGMLGEGSR